MADIVAVITKIEDDEYGGKAFKRVTLGTGQVLKVKQGREGALMAKWGLLKEGVATIFKMKDFTREDGVKIPFVSDIALVADELQPPTKPEILPEHQEVIQEAREAPKYAPQEIGMWWNNLGNRIGDGSIDRDYPNTAVSIKSQYYSKMFKVTGVKPEKEN